MIFVISTSFDSIRNSGSFFWSNKHFHTFSKFIPKNIQNNSITSALIFFNKSIHKTKFAIQVAVDSFFITNSSLKINYHFVKELEYQSFAVKDAVKNLLNLKSILDIPFVSVIDSAYLDSKLLQINLISTIKQLEEKNNWLDIYKLFENQLPDIGDPFWDEPNIINKISFATAKLAECTDNIKKKFQDPKERNKYIQEKKHFRELTIKLRKRAIELEPENPVHYSNLAYSYYQSAMELTTPGGRRDGNFLEDANKALFYIDFALRIDKYRITDIYRKAILNSDLIAEQFFYKKIDENLKEKLEIYQKYINSSIQDFLLIEKLFTNFNEEQKNRYKKTYIKSIYHLAQKYTRLAKVNFNPYNIIYKTNQKYFNNKTELDLLLANMYIDKCIKEDYCKNKPESKIEELVQCNNYLNSVYKSYLKGTINLFLFYILEKKEYELEAKKFLQIAMETNFPPELKNQNKIFILEKIALLHLIKKEPNISIKILEPLYTNKKYLPPFAAYSLSTAYYLNNNEDCALEIIDKYCKQNNDIFKYKFEKLRDLIINKEKLIDSNKFINPYIDTNE